MSVFRFRFEQDTTPDNPRERGTETVMACWHRRYQLGDKHEFAGTVDLKEAVVRQQDPAVYSAIEEALPEETKDTSTEAYELMVEKAFDDIAVSLPLYLYDHSGRSLRTSPFGCKWDSSTIGLIYITAKSFGVDAWTPELREKAVALLKAEVEQYDNYLQGNVWGWSLQRATATGRQVRDVEYNKYWQDDESSWGFYGDVSDNGVQDAARETLRPEWERCPGAAEKIDAAVAEAAKNPGKWVLLVIDDAERTDDKNRGLYNKFIVERTDGSSEPGGKHHGCEYFVLDLDHDKFAVPALLAYASACGAEYPALATDLRNKVSEILKRERYTHERNR